MLIFTFFVNDPVARNAPNRTLGVSFFVFLTFLTLALKAFAQTGKHEKNDIFSQKRQPIKTRFKKRRA